jgi:hypothetical protein
MSSEPVPSLSSGSGLVSQLSRLERRVADLERNELHHVSFPVVIDTRASAVTVQGNTVTVPIARNPMNYFIVQSTIRPPSVAADLRIKIVGAWFSGTGGGRTVVERLSRFQRLTVQPSGGQNEADRVEFNVLAFPQHYSDDPVDQATESFVVHCVYMIDRS